MSNNTNYNENPFTFSQFNYGTVTVRARGETIGYVRQHFGSFGLDVTLSELAEYLQEAVRKVKGRSYECPYRLMDDLVQAWKDSQSRVKFGEYAREGEHLRMAVDIIIDGIVIGRIVENIAESNLMVEITDDQHGLAELLLGRFRDFRFVMQAIRERAAGLGIS